MFLRIGRMLTVMLGLAGLLGGQALAREAAYKISGKTVYVDQVRKADQANFYKIEKERYELIEKNARQAYLEHHWAQAAKKAKKPVDAYKKEYFEKNSKITSKEVNETLDRFKDHPQLKKLSKQERLKQIKEFLGQRKKSEITEKIIADALKSKKLVIAYVKPEEPKYDVTVTSKDFARYGPGLDDVSPKGCKDDCPITVVEYSEFQCPFCARVMPAVKRLLKEYMGKMRWVTRDFPLSFHDRAKPAAIAAHCAGEQKKFWHMYHALFSNQRKLSDSDFDKYARGIKGLDFGKWKKCLGSPAVAQQVDANMATGVKLGVTGTPAFFINGRRLSGALPYSEFKKVFEEELAKRGRSE